MSDKPASGEKLLYCSFCGKSQHEVRKLIAGPSVFICDECIELCNDIIREETATDKGGKDARGNFSDFLVKLLSKGGDATPAGQGGGYDSLGSSLLGTKPGKGRAR